MVYLQLNKVQKWGWFMRILHPLVYQGPRSFRHRKGYFEGWYYKFVSSDNRALAVIPGVSLQRSESFGFIQTIDGSNGDTSYTTYPLSEVVFSADPFQLVLGKSTFSLDQVVLADDLAVSGTITIKEPRLYTATLTRPGIMGWYRYVPFMECYHGVVSTGHSLDGVLRVSTADGSEDVHFDGGRGYIEKDWGTSFPSSYIWMQSNSFSDSQYSCMLSVARIPWFGSYFRGFLGFFDYGDRIITFATYSKAQLTIEDVAEKSVSIRIAGRGSGAGNTLARGEQIVFRAHRSSVGLLMAPQVGRMDRRIGESIDATIELEYWKDGKCEYQGTTTNSGLELVGDMGELRV